MYTIITDIPSTLWLGKEDKIIIEYAKYSIKGGLAPLKN